MGSEIMINDAENDLTVHLILKNSYQIRHYLANL